MSSRRVQTLTLKEKVQLLDQIAKYPFTTYRELGQMFGMPKSTIHRLLKQESLLRQRAAEAANDEAKLDLAVGLLDDSEQMSECIE